MGKVEDMRALREAIRQTQQRMALPPAQRPGKGGKGVKGQRVTMVVIDEAADTPALCGHRSIGNKSCTRPKDHSEKNHRYGK